ncbi:MAG: hypothetical protein ABJF01_24795 [bacterium]
MARRRRSRHRDGEPLSRRAAVVGALGRDVNLLANIAIGAELMVGHLPTGHRACLGLVASPPCDVRELAKFGALSVTGAASFAVAMVTPYVRASAGAWAGHDAGAMGDQSSRETGFALAGEGGIRVAHLAVALRVDQLDGALNGAIRMASIVARVSF